MTFDGHAFQLGFRRPLARALEEDVPADGAELPFACGGNLLVWRDEFRRAGGFDDDYFAYLEDVDLGWRLWAAGRRVLFAREAVVHHRSSATSDLLGLYNRGFLFERNAFLTAYKNYQDGLWERMMPGVMLAFLARTQQLLVHGNPGGGQLALDPYSGHIANTAGAAGTAPQPVPPAAAEPPATWSDFGTRWRRDGARESIRRMEVRDGVRSRFGKGAGYGALVGSAVGLVYGLARGEVYDEPITTPMLVGAGAVAGLVVGGLIGATNPGPVWRTVDARRVSLAVVPSTHSGLALQLAVRF